MLGVMSPLRIPPPGTSYSVFASCAKLGASRPCVLALAPDVCPPPIVVVAIVSSDIIFYHIRSIRS